MRGDPLWGHEAQVVLDAILHDYRFTGWRGFMDGGWAFMESPHVGITTGDMDSMRQWYVDQVACVYRDQPKPGVYMRFRILDPRDV